MLDLEHPEVKFALETAALAASLVKQVREEMTEKALTKEDLSPVTIGDLASQALVAARLSAAFPEAALVAEESAAALRKPEGKATLERVTAFVRRILPDATPDQVCDWLDCGAFDPLSDPARPFWCLDPIDGTKGYLRGDQYAVALAHLSDGVVELGVLACPGLNTSYQPDRNSPGVIAIALRGQGAWGAALEGTRNWQRLSATPETLPENARMLRSFEAAHTNVSQVDQIAQVLGVQAEPVRMDSQAKYTILAAGLGEVILRLLTPTKLDYREKIWDQAAGAIVVEEAGGRISDLDGKPLDFTAGRTLARNRGILATNGLLHEALLRAIREVGA
jgi:3'(2'), 5'-bisphosphate nucleotidase